MIGRKSITATRQFWSVSLPQYQGAGGVYVTKYRIVKPGREGSVFDDFLLALPEKDQLAKFSKEVPLFVRYLKAVTDKENRPEEFRAFLDRAKNGLEVEADIFITTEELLAVMWKNGYTDQERLAVQATFPSDYKFHYPELAAMFDLSEEDTYKYCYRTRTEKSHIGELDASKVTRKGVIRDHWLIFGIGAYILKTYPLFNYYFITKFFGTSLWFFTNWTLMNKFIYKSLARNEYMAQQKTASEVMEGESKIMEAMQRFGHDSNCVEYLKAFKSETQDKLTSYRQAILEQHKVEVTTRATKQLQSIAQYELQITSQLQEMVVRETANAFKSKADDPATQKAFLDSAISALAGGKMENDPVTNEFLSAMNSLEGVDLMTATANPNGTIVERIAAAQQGREKEFRASFMVTSTEANEVRELAQKYGSGGDYDFSQFSEADATRTEQLYKSINQKVGFYVPTDTVAPLEVVGDDDAKKYIEGVNEEIASANERLRRERYTSFFNAFV